MDFQQKILLYVSAIIRKSTTTQLFRSANDRRLIRKLFSRYSLGALIFLAFLVFLIWASVTSIDIFVHGTGKVTADSNNKIIEHLEGGILSELNVSEGQKVTKGMLLFIVENPKLMEVTEVLQEELSEKYARIKRLLAEKQGNAFTLESVVDETPELKDYLYNEWQLYQNRQQALADQRAIIEQKIIQKQTEFEELEQTTQDLGKELVVAKEQRDMLESLMSDRAGSKSNLLERRMDVLRMETRINQSSHKLTAISAELKQLELQKNQLQTDFKEKVQDEFNREMAKIALLEAQVNASRQRESRSEIRAPVSGTLHRLITGTVGEVVSPGTTMAEIVPENEPLMIEARILPKDRARIWPGQKANIRVSAYDYSSYGGLLGTIIDISADTFQSENPPGDYYQVSIATDEYGFGADKPLLQGMTVDAYIVSGKQSVLAYLLPDAFSKQTLDLKWSESAID
ncbi:HlyD family type I secretion periplasmic adaptor subunit [uncultured Endozoicomonas sp.]|uniref:HlyD family type I secretion periplasmic adaptor subunit n=1 Tax=uncultured Endozoicomonas sp. TaxID=432652 RepID=UPI0026107587|nr:HlyD family type I secretion periplasmic adaptor subunit [uncultured Endozoicomonas sp.]